MQVRAGVLASRPHLILLTFQLCMQRRSPTTNIELKIRKKPIAKLAMGFLRIWTESQCAMDDCSSTFLVSLEPCLVLCFCLWRSAGDEDLGGAEDLVSIL